MRLRHYDPPPVVAVTKPILQASPSNDLNKIKEQPTILSVKHSLKSSMFSLVNIPASSCKTCGMK